MGTTGPFEFIMVLSLALSVTLIGFTFVGYPALMYLLARIRPDGEAVQSAVLRSITCVISVFDTPGSSIEGRLKNLFESDLKGIDLDVILVSDGESAEIRRASKAIAKKWPHQLLVKPERTGKAESLNLGIAKAKGDLILLTDIRQSFEPDAIQKMTHHFQNDRVGAVSGLLEIADARSGTGQGVGAYWRLERALRGWEARWDSCVGCTGAIYMIRRELFQEIPSDTLVDDVVIPMLIAAKGYQVHYEPTAIAHDSQPLEPEIEERRKQRTLAGNYQFLFRYPQWLLPWQNRLWWQLIAHKYLRLAAPFLLMTAFVTNLLLCHIEPFRWTMGTQCAFYLLAWTGICFPSIRNKWVAIPSAFVFLNLTSLLGLQAYLTRQYQGGRW